DHGVEERRPGGGQPASVGHEVREREVLRGDSRRPADRLRARTGAALGARLHPGERRDRQEHAADHLAMRTFSDLQAVALIALRTVIGWHFLYEGYYKLMLPAWSRDGQLLGHWSAAAYLKASSGPLAPIFHALAAPSITAWIDRLLPLA